MPANINQALLLLGAEYAERRLLEDENESLKLLVVELQEKLAGAESKLPTATILDFQPAGAELKDAEEPEET